MEVGEGAARHSVSLAPDRDRIGTGRRHVRPIRSASRWWLVRAALLGFVVAGSTGCTREQWARFGQPEPITVQGRRILGLWQGSTIAALAVGGFVLGLILWASFRYRRRGDAMPMQVHYNIPIEVLYTVVPFVIISVLFYFTAVDETYVDKLSKKPDLIVDVVGFQWSWQFNYVDRDATVLTITGRPGQPPQLVIPTGRKILFNETSPDVIHSWWVPSFLFKRDVIPGRTNKFEVTVDRAGTYVGRCAEYCGLYHSRMLFSVKAVSAEEFDSFMSSAKAAASAGTSEIYSVPTAGGGSLS